MMKWDSLRQTLGSKNKKYSQCVYRKVNFARSDIVSENIKKFLEEIKDCEYESSISIHKATRKDSLPLKDNGRSFVDKDRTFFNSELIAKAFKAIGVFKEDGKSCTQYYPHQFSAKCDSTLPLNEGVSIGEEK